MDNAVFIICTALLMGLVFNWGFRHLTGEEWQVLASVPASKEPGGAWKAMTFTYYGFFSACSYVFGLAIFIVLSGSAGLPAYACIYYMLPLLAICVPASRIVAGLVEGKSTTFTVGGAAFVGVTLGPWITLGISELLEKLAGIKADSVAVLAAMAMAYAFGESLGRLACLSFGCCYGKKLADCGPIAQKIFSTRHFIFLGKTKKAVYESSLEGQKLLPIQAVTSMVFAIVGLGCSWLFLEGYFRLSAVACLVCTQGWRLLSEFFRADYRGKGKISAYQIMGIAGIIYCLVVIPLMPSPESTPAPDVIKGLQTLASIELILTMQTLWAAIFIYTGKSKVINSKVQISVPQGS